MIMVKIKKQDNESNILPTGKLSIDLLKEVFDAYNSSQVMKILQDSSFKELYEDSRKRVKMGFSIGEDAAVIDVGSSDTFLVAKTDPITFATEDIGYYVVNVNANDCAAMGATPKWFQVTILLPSNITTKEIAKKICLDIQKACLNLGIYLIGGHTEVTYGLKRPIVIGSMIGEVKKEHFVHSGGGKPGDAIILTKEIPLEGTALIAREKEHHLLKMGISPQEIQRSKNLLFTPGISVIKEALLAVQAFKVHSMHDPTEGGLAMGLIELSKASNCGFHVYYESIPIIPEGRKFCDIFQLNPLQTLSSGSLLIVVDNNDSDNLLELLWKHDVAARKIGLLTKKKRYLLSYNNVTKEIEHSERDEIAKIFEDD